MSEVDRKSWNLNIWRLQLLTALGWTLLSGWVWVSWTLASTERLQATQPDPDTAIGFAAMISMGCVGGTWFVGLIVVAVVASMLRRPA